MTSLDPSQLLLTFEPVIVEKVATLLTEMMTDNCVVSRLYLTGAYFFVMMYTGSNVLPVARFLRETHRLQAFRSDEVVNCGVCVCVTCRLPHFLHVTCHISSLSHLLLVTCHISYMSLVTCPLFQKIYIFV